MSDALREYGTRLQILPPVTITTAVSNQVSSVFAFPAAKYLGVFAKFAWGSGGTTAKAWLQTSFDNGVTWCDIASLAFTTAILNKVCGLSADVAATHATPTDGSLADNTINNGILGDKFRVKYTTTGTYAGGTTLEVDVVFKQ